MTSHVNAVEKRIPKFERAKSQRQPQSSASQPANTGHGTNARKETY